jgi:GT2 family glycosyltransferase
MPDISIIICTYNPDVPILDRCLTAVSSLNRGGLSVECFLVDNNSLPPIIEHETTQRFLKTTEWASLLIEKEQGLTSARLCGFRASSGRWILFIDDDNEPDIDYLLGVADYAERHPTVGAFGPGEVAVDYTDTVEPWLLHEKPRFQEKKIEIEQHSRDTDEYKDHYPFGTGLALRREVLQEYERLRDEGLIRTSDRKGKSLASGGDIQLVWLAIRMGFEAGTTPALKIGHMISGEKANRQYLRRHAYGCACTSVQARLEIFPEDRPLYESRIIPAWKSLLVLGQIFLRNLSRNDLDLQIAGQIGLVHSYRDFFRQRRPRHTEWLTSILGLE